MSLFQWVAEQCYDRTRLKTFKINLKIYKIKCSLPRQSFRPRNCIKHACTAQVFILTILRGRSHSVDVQRGDRPTCGSLWGGFHFTSEESVLVPEELLAAESGRLGGVLLRAAAAAPWWWDCINSLMMRSSIVYWYTVASSCLQTHYRAWWSFYL